MTNVLELAKLWPAVGLRVQAGNLELRWIDDSTLLSLADLASRGAHAPDQSPFGNGWATGTPTEVARSVLAFQWSRRGQVSRDDFALELAVILDGVPVGIQGLHGAQWSVLRTVSTGSWLGVAHQGRGTGKRMRALMLHVAFAALGAEEATTTAFADNVASNRVSDGLGYEPDGAFRDARAGSVVLHNRYRMSRERWEELRDDHDRLLGAPVILHGLEPFLEQIR